MKNKQRNNTESIIRRPQFDIYFDLLGDAVLNGYTCELAIYYGMRAMLPKMTMKGFTYNKLASILKIKKAEAKRIIRRLKKVGLVEKYDNLLVIPDPLEVMSKKKPKYSIQDIIRIDLRYLKARCIRGVSDSIWKIMYRKLKEKGFKLDLRDENPFDIFRIGIL